MYPLSCFPKGGIPPRQAGSFAKIAHRAIFERSALPVGEEWEGGINKTIIII